MVDPTAFDRNLFELSVNERLARWSKALGIKWKFEFVISEMQRARIISYAPDQVHQIYLPEEQVYNPDLWDMLWGNLLHELVHAYLAEKIAPIFSGVAKRHPKPNEQPKLYEKQAQEIWLAQEIVDVWVDRLMLDVDRDVALIYAQYWFIDKKLLTDAELRAGLSEVTFELAIQIADVNYAGLSIAYTAESLEIYQRIRKLCNNKLLRQLDQLIKLADDLPALKINDPKEAVKQLAEATAKTAQILGLSVKPELRRDLKTLEYYWHW